MTRDEFAVFGMLLKTAYPRDSLLPNKEAMEMWFRMLQHIPFNIAEAILQKWIGTNKWPPTIAEILDNYTELKGEVPKTWETAWKEVQDAISHFGYIGEEEAFKSFDSLTANVVGKLGWRNLCLSDNLISDRANFRNVYEILYKREREIAQLPPALKEKLKEIGESNGTSPLLDSGQTDNQKELHAARSLRRSDIPGSVEGLQKI